MHACDVSVVFLHVQCHDRQTDTGCVVAVCSTAVASVVGRVRFPGKVGLFPEGVSAPRAKAAGEGRQTLARGRGVLD